jgi:hypothetical protein
LKISVKISAFLTLLVLASILFRAGHISAQDFPLAVGRIEGDDLVVATTTASGIETNAAPTVVASGSDVTLRSGHALLTLNEGGEVSICGPAHFKVIKSSRAVTLALDYGRVHPSLDSADTFTIYTPTVVATPIAISGGRRDMTLGLEQNGEMCVLTSRGALRVEPQFGEQAVIVPQGGNVSLAGGQIQSFQADASACSCDFPRASLKRPKPASPSQTPPSTPSYSLGVLSHPQPPEGKKSEDSTAPSTPSESPVYTVLMPPLTFDSHSPQPPPEPDPETILLVREVRLRPAAVFRGRVNPAPAQATVRPAPSPAPTPSEDQPLPSQPSFLDRVRTFFRKLTSMNRTSCSGTGCSG